MGWGRGSVSCLNVHPNIRRRSSPRSGARSAAARRGPSTSIPLHCSYARAPRCPAVHSSPERPAMKCTPPLRSADPQASTPSGQIPRRTPSALDGRPGPLRDEPGTTGATWGLEAPWPRRGLPNAYLYPLVDHLCPYSFHQNQRKT